MNILLLIIGCDAHFKFPPEFDDSLKYLILNPVVGYVTQSVNPITGTLDNQVLSSNRLDQLNNQSELVI